MALTGNTTVLASLQWTQVKTKAGFASITTPTQTKKLQLVPTAGVANKIYNAELTFTASSNQTIDLSSFVDDVGDTVTPSKAVAILVIPTGTGSVCKIEPGAANGLAWFFGGTTPSHSIPAGGAFLHAEPLGATIDGTHKTIKLSETGGAAMTVDVMVLCLQ